MSATARTSFFQLDASIVGIYEYGPVILGSGTVTAISKTCWLCWARICNPTSGEISFTIQDRQDTPVPIVSVQAVAPSDGKSSGMFIFSSAGDNAPGGVSITTSASGLAVYLKALPNRSNG